MAEFNEEEMMAEFEMKASNLAVDKDLKKEENDLCFQIHSDSNEENDNEDDDNYNNDDEDFEATGKNSIEKKAIDSNETGQKVKRIDALNQIEEKKSDPAFFSFDTIENEVAMNLGKTTKVSNPEVELLNSTDIAGDVSTSINREDILIKPKPEMECKARIYPTGAQNTTIQKSLNNEDSSKDVYNYKNDQLNLTRKIENIEEDKMMFQIDACHDLKSDKEELLAPQNSKISQQSPRENRIICHNLDLSKSSEEFVRKGAQIRHLVQSALNLIVNNFRADKESPLSVEDDKANCSQSPPSKRSRIELHEHDGEAHGRCGEKYKKQNFIDCNLKHAQELAREKMSTCVILERVRSYKIVYFYVMLLFDESAVLIFKIQLFHYTETGRSSTRKKKSTRSNIKTYRVAE